MKFYTNGIVREMNMTNSQKKALEKRRSEWKIKYEKEKLAEQYEKDHPEEAKKIKRRIKKIRRRRRKKK
jgi:c-di-GMP-related signal transduction protein